MPSVYLSPPGRARRVFSFPKEGASVANHFTPEELSEELGIDRDEIVRVCIQESIPIYHGKIDKSLFLAQLQATGANREAD